jgi:signal transduction histidine kinase
MVTIPTLLLSTLVSLHTNDIGAYISILGGFCSITFVILVPVMIYVKTNDYKIYHWKNIGSILLCLILCGSGYIAGYRSLIKLLNQS